MGLGIYPNPVKGEQAMVAVYVRQSIDKKDSISIETQIEECKKKLYSNEPYEIFSDKGFSGKSVDNRPEFQRMMAEVENGNVSRIIIYKYDRISRSLYDFINMQREFKKYNTSLVSVNEQFDTSTSQGKAMVNILMTFAEMERETIQQRISDNYYSRGEKGFYLGGYAPFGYNKVDTYIDKKKTCKFEINQSESKIVKKLYEDFLNGKSLNQLARELNSKNIQTRKKRPWSATCISRLLKNPVYVKANADIYNYLLGLGATINNPIEDFMGENGCIVYGKAGERTTSKFVNYKTDYVTLAPHKGIIDSDLWLAVQNIFSRKKGHSNTGSGSLSWLQGLIKCKCGYTYYIKKFSPNKNGKVYRYLYCRGRRNNSCPYSHKMMSAERVEMIAQEALFNRLNELKNVEGTEIVKDSPEINELKIELSKIESKIKNLVLSLAQSNDVAMEYINKSIAELDKEKNEILEQITNLQLQSQNREAKKLNIDNILANWDSYNTELKKRISKIVIDVIVVEGNNIDIKFF